MINTPPYCPNPSCTEHLPKEKGVLARFRKRGFFTRTLYPFRLQRFQCRCCQKTCSLQSFHLSFRYKRASLDPLIFNHFVSGASNRQISRNLSCSEHLIRIRLTHMARFSLIEHSRKLRRHLIFETLVYDGLENFAASQYDPNNINQVLGSKSLFMYDFSFAPLNRKGYTSPRQKLKKQFIEKTLGRYPKNTLRSSTAELFERISKKWDYQRKPSMQVASDQHFQYSRCFKLELAHLQIEHATVSSKATRTYKHILFAVNHTDMLIRHHTKAFTRETIAFSKTAVAMVEKYMLFMTWKNYMRAKFIKPHKADPRCNVESPAQAAGIESKILKFHEFFCTKYTPLQVEVSKEWKLFLAGSVGYLRGS